MGRSPVTSWLTWADSPCLMPSALAGWSASWGGWGRLLTITPRTSRYPPKALHPATYMGQEEGLLPKNVNVLAVRVLLV